MLSPMGVVGCRPQFWKLAYVQSVFSILDMRNFDFVESLRSETYPDTARTVAKNSKRRKIWNLEIALG